MWGDRDAENHLKLRMYSMQSWTYGAGRGGHYIHIDGMGAYTRNVVAAALTGDRWCNWWCVAQVNPTHISVYGCVCLDALYIYMESGRLRRIYILTLDSVLRGLMNR